MVVEQGHCYSQYHSCADCRNNGDYRIIAIELQIHATANSRMDIQSSLNRQSLKFIQITPFCPFNWTYYVVSLGPSTEPSKLSTVTPK